MITKNNKKSNKAKYTYDVRIDSIEKTEDVLSDRAGLVLFVRYLSKTGIYPLIEKYFGSMRKSRKGIPIRNIFKQLFYYFTDGISLHLTHFDDLSRNRGYAETIIESYHNRGNDELINRVLKEFGTEKLPFKRFLPNMAFYYSMALSFFLYESFKRDVAKEIIDVKSYPTTVRRVLIDFAGKIIHTGRRIILKVSWCIYKRLNIPLLWKRCNSPPVISTA